MLGMSDQQVKMPRCFFDVNMLPEHLERLATEQGGNLAGFISTLGLRIRGMLADQRLGAVIARDPPYRWRTG
jgi:uncharacterized protein